MVYIWYTYPWIWYTYGIHEWWKYVGGHTLWRKGQRLFWVSYPWPVQDMLSLRSSQKHIVGVSENTSCSQSLERILINLIVIYRYLICVMCELFYCTSPISSTSRSKPCSYNNTSYLFVSLVWIQVENNFCAFFLFMVKCIIFVTDLWFIRGKILARLGRNVMRRYWML